MTTDLAAERGLATAARRLGSIPFDLPAGFFAKFAGEDIDPTQITSAGHALVYLRGLQGKPDVSTKREQLVGILLDRLAAQAELFAAFLWKGARQLYRSTSWRRLHPSFAFGLLWVWADRLTSSIASCGVYTEKVAEMIRRSEPAELTHAFRQDGIPEWFRDYAFRIEDEVVVGAMVAAALQAAPLMELPEGLRTRILTAIGNIGETSWFPKVPITFPRRPVPGLWISSDPVDAVVQSGTTTIPAFAARSPDDHVRALLAESVNPERPFVVTGLLSVADLSTVTEETARELVVYIDKLLADFPHQSADASYRNAACIKAQCLGVKDDREQMRSMMSQLASYFAAAHGHRKTVYTLDPELSPAMKDLVQLLEMAIAFARRPPVLPERKWRP